MVEVDVIAERADALASDLAGLGGLPMVRELPGTFAEDMAGDAGRIPFACAGEMTLAGEAMGETDLAETCGTDI